MLSALHAVMSVRTPQGTIAWIAALITIAPVSVPAYWVFGRNKFRGYVLAREQDLRYLDQVIHEASAGISRGNITRVQSSRLQAAERLARLPVTTGNSVELLIDGEATFASIFDGIEQARVYLMVQFYIVRDDELGRDLKSRMLERARVGVKVFFLFDEIGSVLVMLAGYSFFEEIKGVGVRVFRYREGFLHGKYALIDDSLSIIGTANFDNRSFRLNFEITAAVMDGEFANQVAQMFEHDFARSRLMQPGAYLEKPVWFRLAARLSRLAAPVL